MPMGRYSSKWGAAVAALAGLAGCSAGSDPVIGVAASRPQAELGQQGYSSVSSGVYLLRPSDQISVNVFREPDFSVSDVQIGVEGKVSLPFLGAIPAAGMTSEQFEDDVARRFFAAGIRNPMVSVNIVKYASHLVTVEGAVVQPGVYPFQPGARLSSAIALARGASRVADARQVAVFRDSAEGVTVAKFDYRQVSSGTMLDPVLHPNDRVVVGTDGLSVLWQDFLRSVPVFGVFANAGNL